MKTLLADPELKGVILTVPNEQHLPVAQEVAKARKHIYTEKPIANTLEDGLRIEALQKQYGVQVVVGHSARLLIGTRLIRQAIDRGELGRVAFIEANFSNERALELTPKTWRWYKDKAPGGPLSQLAIHQFDALHYLGGEISRSLGDGLEAFSRGRGSRRPVDDAHALRRRQSRLRRLVLDFAGHLLDPRVRLQRAHALRDRLQHVGYAGPAARELDALHPARQGRLRQARRAQAPAGDMFRDELEMFAETCATGKPCELTAHNGNVAVAVVYAALRSIERKGCARRSHGRSARESSAEVNDG